MCTTPLPRNNVKVAKAQRPQRKNQIKLYVLCGLCVLFPKPIIPSKCSPDETKWNPGMVMRGETPDSAHAASGLPAAFVIPAKAGIQKYQ